MNKNNANPSKKIKSYEQGLKLLSEAIRVYVKKHQQYPSKNAMYENIEKVAKKFNKTPYKVLENLNAMAPNMSVKKKLFEDDVPNNAPAKDQLHVFDFDDTLGITDNPNGILMYMNGKPAHKDVSSAQQWLKSSGLEKYLKSHNGKPTIVMSPELGGAVFYLDSAGLAKLQKHGITTITYSPSKSPNIPKEGMAAVVDYSPSNDIKLDTTKPIDQSLDRLKAANAAGASTAIMTARKGSGEATGMDGKTVPVSNEKDIAVFLKKQGAMPNSGIMGVNGANKGEEINKKFISGKKDNPPKEIHFYDDSERNTINVKNALAGKAPSELYIYGPGHFSDGEASAEKPKESYEEPKDKEAKKVAESLWEQFKRSHE